MTKRKQKISNPKKTGRIRHNNVSAALIDEMCSVSDPFCKHAIGAKHPAGTSTQTVTFYSDQLYPVVTNSDGEAVVFIRPSSDTDVAAFPTVAGNNYTVPAAFSIGVLAPDYISTCRVVSAGVKYLPNIAATSQPGYLAGKLFMNDEDVLGVTETAIELSVHADFADRANKGFTYVFPSADEHEFKPVKVSGANNESSNGILGFYVNSVPSSTVGFVRIVVHYECEIDRLDGAHMATFGMGSKSPHNPFLWQWYRQQATAGFSALRDSEFANGVKQSAAAFARAAGVYTVRKGVQYAVAAAFPQTAPLMIAN
jgi:hypothetical protein